MSKQSKSFRLSEQAVQKLAQLVEQTGASETALVEISLAYLFRLLAEKADPGVRAVEPVRSDAEALDERALEMGVPVEVIRAARSKPGGGVKPGKHGGRKRH